MKGLEGRVALVTGVGGGIGRALVETLAGYGMVVAGLDHPEGPAMPDGLAAAASADVRDAARTAEAIAEIAGRVGRIEVLVSNAGYTRAEHMGELDAAAWRAEVEANLAGHYHAFAAVAPAMRTAGRGTIVNISSVNALQHYGSPAYAAAKAGLLAFTRAVAVEEGRHGLRAVAVAPGTVRTPAWDKRAQSRPQILERMAHYYPLGRVVEPDEVAQLVAFLASDLAGAITGCVVPIDCGLTAGNRPMAFEIANIEG